MTTLERFTRYTTGKEPVLTVNTVAAILLGVVVVGSERYLGIVWDEFMLTVAGLVTISAATWLARRGVFSPVTHDEAVDEALHTPVPGEGGGGGG